MYLEGVYQSIRSTRDTAEHHQPTLLYGHSHAQLDTFINELGRMIVCTGTAKPCNACMACVHSRQGTYQALFDIAQYQSDTSETYGLEAARRFMQWARLQARHEYPSVGLLRRVDEYTFQAQNALLKIFEEAPAHCYILMTARRLQGLPATLLSRVTRVRLTLESQAISNAYSASIPKDPTNDVLTRIRQLLAEPTETQSRAYEETFADAEKSLRLFLMSGAATGDVRGNSRPFTRAVTVLHGIARAKKHLARNAHHGITLQSILCNAL